MLHEEEQNEEQNPPSRLKRFVYGLIAFTVIGGLLASSVAGVAYYIRARQIDVLRPVVNRSEVATAVSPHTPTTPSAPARATASQTVPNTGASLNRIVLINDDGQVETVSPDGSQRRVLTDDNGGYRFPAWSPDGSRIAAIGGGSVSIITDDPQVAVDERMFDDLGTPIYLYWSPDSQQVSFIANNPNVGDLELHLTSLDGNPGSRRIASGTPFYWNWSADSQSMLVHPGSPLGAEGAGPNLYLLGVEEAIDHLPVFNSGFFQTPGISANGRYWGYSQFSGNGNAWLVVDDRQTDTQIKERHAGAVALSWSPTHDQLAFISGGEGETTPWGALRLMDVDTGQVDLLSSDRVLAFFWSPDGRKIVYLSVPSDIQGETINAALPFQKPGRGLSKTAVQPGLQFRLSVVDVEAGSGLLLTELLPSRLFLAQFLPFFDQYALSHRLWSPDSQSIVLPIDDGEQGKIVVIDVANGRQREVGTGSIAFWSQQ